MNAIQAPAAVGQGQDLVVTATVTNPHRARTSGVVQLYLRKETGLKAAQRELAGFARVELKPGESRSVPFALTARQIASVRTDGTRSFAPGTLKLWAGTGQPDARSKALGVQVVETSVAMK